jgi:hypothetical protein
MKQRQPRSIPRSRTISLPRISTSLNRRSENVVIEAVIIAELKLCDIQREVFCTDFVERTDDTALENAPKSFNRLGVNRADNVLALGMVNGRVGVVLVETLVANPLISAEQADFFGNGLVNERLKGRRFERSRSCERPRCPCG